MNDVAIIKEHITSFNIDIIKEYLEDNKNLNLYLKYILYFSSEIDDNKLCVILKIILNRLFYDDDININNNILLSLPISLSKHLKSKKLLYTYSFLNRKVNKMFYNIDVIYKKLKNRKLIETDIYSYDYINDGILKLREDLSNNILKKVLATYDCNFHNSSFFNRLKQSKNKPTDVIINQMIDRLRIIFDLFGMDLLKEYDVNVINNTEFEDYEFKTKVDYFREVCLKVTSVFKYYINYIDQYLSKKNDLENLLSFNIIIESASESDKIDELIIDTDIPNFNPPSDEDNEESEKINVINESLNIFIEKDDNSCEMIIGEDITSSSSENSSEENIENST